MCSKVSFVRSSHDLCVLAHAHSLEGTLIVCELNDLYILIVGNHEGCRPKELVMHDDREVSCGEGFI